MVAIMGPCPGPKWHFPRALKYFMNPLFPLFIYPESPFTRCHFSRISLDPSAFSPNDMYPKHVSSWMAFIPNTKLPVLPTQHNVVRFGQSV